MQLPDAAAKDKLGLVSHRIGMIENMNILHFHGECICFVEQLKRRLNRRLIKLAKWADIPQEERQPKERISALRSIVPTSYGN